MTFLGGADKKGGLEVSGKPPQSGSHLIQALKTEGHFCRRSPGEKGVSRARAGTAEGRYRGGCVLGQGGMEAICPGLFQGDVLSSPYC